MALIGAHQLTKSFGSQALFKELTFSIDKGERIGLIGPNGAGKSTLLKIFADQEDYDDGKLAKSKGLQIGYLEQIPKLKPGATINESVMEGAKDIHDWEDIARAQEYMSKLNLDQFDPDTLVENLSGGWKKRVALARELVRMPELLLLDEPTNHLDVESILWLEDFIARSDLTTVTITHDRVFLQNISNRIIEIDKRHPKGLLSVDGDYLRFLETREDLLSAQEQQETKLRNTLRRETEWLRRGPKARTTKSQARIKGAGVLKDTVEDLNTRNKTDTVRLDFQATDRAPKKLIEAKNISKFYDGKVIIPAVDVLITPKTRLGLMGINGCGKSTLIRLLTKTEESDSGEIKHAEKIKITYFEQNRESLDPKLSGIKTVCPSGDKVNFCGQDIHINSYLARFLFTHDQMQKEVGKLSGGEQSRLLLAKLMLTEANVLVLDEPTNDLDMATLDVLGEVLQAFKGAIILVTHDRYFLDQMTDQILAFGINEDGDKALEMMSGLEQWEEWHAEQEKIKQKVDAKVNNTAVNNVAKPATQKKKLGFKEQRELDNMEENIATAETHLAALTKEANHPEVVANPSRLLELTKEMDLAQKAVESLYARWSDLSEYS